MIIDAVIMFLRDTVIGNPVFFALISLFIFGLFLIISRTGFDNIFSFLLIPAFYLNDSGYFVGIYAAITWGIMLIIAGSILFRNIKKLVG